MGQESVDVIVLYPAQNGRAPSFWASMGYAEMEKSHLPKEELKPFQENGPLLPEMDPQANALLPRWEKRIQAAKEAARTCERPLPQRPDRLRHVFRPNELRARPAADSRVRGTPLLKAFEGARDEQRRWRESGASVHGLRSEK